MSLDQRIAEAARLGMSYGKYMAWRREQGIPESHHKPKPILETETVNVGVCVICGGNIMRRNRRGTPNTCSKECKDELNRRRARGRYHEKKTEHPKGVEHTCEVCGKKFRGEPRMKYCSEDCRAEANRRRTRAKYRRFHPEANKFLKRNCLHCGAEFETQNIRKVFCSKKCCAHYSKGGN